MKVQDELVGLWVLESVDNYDNFLDAQEVTMLVRTAANAEGYGVGSSTLDISFFEDCSIVLSKVTTTGTFKNAGKIDDGKHAGEAPYLGPLECTYTLDDRTLIAVSSCRNHKKDVIETYAVEGGKILKTLQAGNVFAKETFARPQQTCAVQSSARWLPSEAKDDLLRLLYNILVIRFKQPAELVSQVKSKMAELWVLSVVDLRLALREQEGSDSCWAALKAAILLPALFWHSLSAEVYALGSALAISAHPLSSVSTSPGSTPSAAPVSPYTPRAVPSRFDNPCYSTAIGSALPKMRPKPVENASEALRGLDAAPRSADELQEQLAAAEGAAHAADQQRICLEERMTQRVDELQEQLAAAEGAAHAADQQRICLEERMTQRVDELQEQLAAAEGAAHAADQQRICLEERMTQRVDELQEQLAAAESAATSNVGKVSATASTVQQVSNAGQVATAGGGCTCRAGERCTFQGPARLSSTYAPGELRESAARGEACRVQALLQDGALPNACVERDGDDCTPLYLAVAGGHVSTAKVLISFGADVNLACSMGQAPTPLHIAVSRDAVELVEILLASGADVNAPYKRSPVHLAFARGHQEVLAAILRVPSVDVKSPAAENWTVLHISAEKGHAAPVKMILDKDVDAVNARSSNNSTPLHLAARHGHQHIVQLLVETGRLDIDAVARDNFTPMLNAVHGNHMHTVQYLLGKGANAKNAWNCCWHMEQQSHPPKRLESTPSRDRRQQATERFSLGVVIVYNNIRYNIYNRAARHELSGMAPRYAG
ncbi:hypothetical protein CYMTET_49061 [Cymbomonas tetramitiformis]|uniref:Uncharacterized protein n=1 Tax=Cymbomonas tetramitiformis TaxID=36881 RepID=A0AAE0EUI1_9CHLO|nr:hypothetical protein CYMTET_49061 [Cymbomonas tetramitiformis]